MAADLLRATTEHAPENDAWRGLEQVKRDGIALSLQPACQPFHACWDIHVTSLQSEVCHKALNVMAGIGSRAELHDLAELTCSPRTG